MTAILVCGGTLSAAFLREFTQKHKHAMLYAVDGGLTVVHEAGLKPDYLVGDFDTVSEELVCRYEKQCVVLRHKPEKDATDTELALDAALDSGIREIFLLGATGSRMDHTLANINMLYRALLKGGQAQLVDEHNRISLHGVSFTRRKEELFGDYVSFLPLFGETADVTLKGMKYPLKAHTLTMENSLGVSNEAIDSQIEVSFTKGYLLMIEARD